MKDEARERDADVMEWLRETKLNLSFANGYWSVFDAETGEIYTEADDPRAAIDKARSVYAQKY